MTMGPGEILVKFTFTVDSVAKRLQRLGKIVNEDDKSLEIMSGLSEKCEVDRRMLYSGDDRTHIEKFITNQ